MSYTPTGTGTIQSAASQVVANEDHDRLQLSFVNGSGGELVQGQEVTLKSDGTVDKRDATTENALGTVVVGGANTNKVTVRINCTRTLNAHAKGGTLTAGTAAYPDGTFDADGTPNYLTQSSGVVSAIVLKGNTVGGAVIIGILNAPHQIDTGNLTPAAEPAYSSDAESVAYTGITPTTLDAASITDLNALRTAYENLRTYTEGLVTALKATGVIAP